MGPFYVLATELRLFQSPGKGKIYGRYLKKHLNEIPPCRECRTSNRTKTKVAGSHYSGTILDEASWSIT